MNQFFVLIYLSGISALLLLKPIDTSHCESITVPVCAEELSYNVTRFPNYFNHESQEEAGLELNSFWPLFEVQCAPELRLFLCLLFVPVCNVADIVVPPCKELCEESRDGCGPIIQSYGFSWPDHLQCEQFPSTFRDDICLMPDSPKHSSDIFTETVPRIPKLGEVAESKCEVLKSTFCAGHVPYNTTIFPNILNHPSQREAAAELDMYFPLVEMECASPLLRLYVCSAYNPYCNESSETVSPPCREFCEQATAGCAGFDNQLGFVWPRYMRCERFPSHNDSPTCIMPEHFEPQVAATTESAPEVQEELDEKNSSIPYLIAVFRERVDGINESMREVRAENIRLQAENQELREEVAALREELAASKGVALTRMDKFEESITEKLADLKLTLYDYLTTTRADISQQIQQSCEN